MRMYAIWGALDWLETVCVSIFTSMVERMCIAVPPYSPMRGYPGRPGGAIADVRVI